MLASERLSTIVKLTDERGYVSTKDLAKTLKVTETTIRRDSENLENNGLLLRVHGGVKSVAQKSILSKLGEVSMKERTENYDKKEAVAKMAASFVQDGSCIFLDGGTSVAPMVKHLKDKKIKIVTHSSLVVNEFEESDAQLFVLGGAFIPEYCMNVGPMTIRDLEEFNFDFAFIGSAGIDIEKEIVYAAEMDSSTVKKKAISLSNRSFLLIDDSKLEVKGFNSFMKSDLLDGILCNDAETLKQLELPNNFITVE